MPGGTYFFTVNLLERRRTLVRHIGALREAVRVTRREQPFHIDAWVVLPDHRRLRLPYALAELNPRNPRKAEPPCGFRRMQPETYCRWVARC